MENQPLGNLKLDGRRVNGGDWRTRSPKSGSSTLRIEDDKRGQICYNQFSALGSMFSKTSAFSGAEKQCSASTGASVLTLNKVDRPTLAKGLSHASMKQKSEAKRTFAFPAMRRPPLSNRARKRNATGQIWSLVCSTFALRGLSFGVLLV